LISFSTERHFVFNFGELFIFDLARCDIADQHRPRAHPQARRDAFRLAAADRP
jgi:hypothetical protein